MTTPITLKNAAGTDCVFAVIRQPSAGVSAILSYMPAGATSRSQAVKIELSANIVNGRTAVASSVAVPYGRVRDGVYEKINQVVDFRRGTTPADVQPGVAADAEAFGRNLASNPQVMALFKDGFI